MREIYQKNNLRRFGAWKAGDIPIDYTIPKQKDPINKARLITSYAQHTLRNILKNTSRILTWMFRSVREAIGMFTLFLDDLKKRLLQIKIGLNKCYGRATKVLSLQSDINKMYTNLDHCQIMDSIIWLCGVASNEHIKKKRKTRKDRAYITISKKEKIKK